MSYKILTNLLDKLDSNKKYNNIKMIEAIELNEVRNEKCLDTIMKEKYMIVRVVNILSQDKHNNSMITEDCYKIIDKDYDTAESAYRGKEKYREPQNYIVVQYWC